VLRTFDHPLPKPWTPGTPIVDDFNVYQSGLGEPLPAGSFRLTVGLFDTAGHRWALDGLGPSIARSEYAGATVESTSRPRARISSSPTRCGWRPKPPATARSPPAAG